MSGIHYWSTPSELLQMPNRSMTTPRSSLEVVEPWNNARIDRFLGEILRTQLDPMTILEGVDLETGSDSQ